MSAVPEPLDRRPRFGTDGALYVSAGDGASFNYVDYGQSGGSGGSPTPKNPCGDPPARVGGTHDPADGRGRRASHRASGAPSGEPVLLNGAILRVDPATGDALPTTHCREHGCECAADRRLRLPQPVPVHRPAGHERALDRRRRLERLGGDRSAADPTSGGGQLRLAVLRGERSAARLPGRGPQLCSPCTAPGRQPPPTSPTTTPNTSSPATPARPEARRSRDWPSIRVSTYPAFYNGGLFFADYARSASGSCPPGRTGCLIRRRSSSSRRRSESRRPRIGPDGDLFYADIFGGTINEISYSTGPSDLARGQPATASSSETSTTTPNKANDGNSGTRWSSSFADNQWWQVDLGSVKPVDR